MCAYIYIWYAQNYRWLNPIISQLVSFIAHVCWNLLALFFPAPEATASSNRAHPWRNCGMQQCSWETCGGVLPSNDSESREDDPWGNLIVGGLFSDNPWSRRCFWLRWSCLLFFSQTLVYKCKLSSNINQWTFWLSTGGLFLTIFSLNFARIFAGGGYSIFAATVWPASLATPAGFCSKTSGSPSRILVS